MYAHITGQLELFDADKVSSAFFSETHVLLHVTASGRHKVGNKKSLEEICVILYFCLLGISLLPRFDNMKAAFTLFLLINVRKSSNFD